MKREKYRTYRIGFNDNDETEFDVVQVDRLSEMAELMRLFIHFLRENPDIEIDTIDYVEVAEED